MTNTSITTQAHDFTVGDFATYAFPGISVVLEVIKTTAKSITIRETKDIRNSSDNYVDGVISYTEIAPDKDGETKTYRVRKDGTLRVGSYARAPRIYKSVAKNGKHFRTTDYSY